MQEARGTPSPVPTHSFSASSWHRHQLTGSFVCANCAAPQSPCVVYSIHGLVALLLRFSVVVGGAVEHPAAQIFKRARLWHLHYIPPTRSSLLDRGAQDVICGPIFSWCFGLQRRGSMLPHGLGMACTWEEQRTSRGRSRSFDWSSYSSAPRGTWFSMCSEERYSECTGGLWRPRIGFFALLGSYRGRVGMSSAQDRLKMRFSGRTKKFRVWTK
jgi:hypothetical protein